MDDQLKMQDLEPEKANQETPEEVVEGDQAEVPEEEKPEPEPEKPKYYTPEELSELLETDADIDTSRLTDEGKAIMKSFQRGLTPKLQERSELRREVDELKKKLETSKKPQTIEEAFDQDPDGTMQYIDGQLGDLRGQAKAASDPDQKLEFLSSMEEIRAVRDRLVARGIANQRQMTNQQAVITEAVNKIYKAIPDFDTKQKKLTDFAINDLGYSQAEVMQLSDPSIVGPGAVKFIKTINKFYDKENAKETLTQKEVKVPPKTEKTGKTGEPFDKSAAYQRALKKAKDTGDFTEVLTMKGTIGRLSPGG